MSERKEKPWCYIPINKGHRAKIDKEDFERVSLYTWRVIRKPSGRLRVVGRVKTKDGFKVVSLAHFLVKPPKNKMVYVRRFMDELDYRKSNLIVCTMSERQRILPKSRLHGTSKYKGVSFIENGKKWRAQIEVDRQHISLGVFRSETEAAAAYNRAAREYFGEMAYQNAVKETPRTRRKT